ncbi:Matrix metallo ase-24 [Paramuricea clavata]|uniref:Matrix metallo ase-24, partial n=1 Tax=Paramuricea clavata TaxID=317549 RepID=A0A6S7H022_PARCT|nr:Matrix metallo ase-24 [Paramuricea clavata]
MKVYAAYLVLLLVWKFRIGQSAQKKKKKDPYNYLMRYGYIKTMTDLVSHAHTADAAIRKFQRYAQLPVTGKMDRATKSKLTGPRCGAQDFRPITPKVAGLAVRGIPVASFRDMRRKKRYVQQGTKWQKQSLTWSLHSYPSHYVSLSRADVVRTLDKAFKMWQSVSQLNFKKLSNNRQADIIVLFGRGDHNDPYRFDGRGGTLAHGYYPGSNTGLAGDIHFDDDETWSLNGRQGTTDLLWTSLHEIGHAIGLEHSQKRDAIMWPWFEGYQAGLKLRQDDISGIQSIYGVRSGDTTCPATNEKKPKVSSLCNYGNLNDVIYHKATCTTYIFRGYYMWRMNNAKQASNHERISSKFRGLPGYIDAGYSRNDGSMVFFKNNRYWIYDKNFRKIKGSARLSNFIKNSKATGLDRIDAAMVWDGNSRVYFFRRDKYWRYNEERKEIDPGYPKKISVWRGVKSPVDGAFSWKNSRSFFLRANNIDKFNNYKFAVQKGRGLKKFIRNC